MPRRADPEVATALIDAAARLLGEEGPTALSTRRLAAEVGTSTTAVYTHFGSKPEMVRAMVAEGFGRLARREQRVRRTDDPITDLANLGWAYRRHARADPHLYRVMFGRTVPEFQPTPEDRAQGIPALEIVVGAVRRAIDAGRLDPMDPWDGAVSIWTAAHGVVSLELDGYLGAGSLFDGVRTLRSVMLQLTVGMGDDPARARASVGATRP